MQLRSIIAPVYRHGPACAGGGARTPLYMREYLFGCHKRTTALDLAHQTWPKLNQDLKIGFAGKKVDGWPDRILSGVEGFLII